MFNRFLTLFMVLVLVLGFALPGVAITPLEYTANNYPSRNVDVGVNVKWFGAYLDGVHDDTAAVQNALNAGYKLVMFTGDMVVSSKLTIPPNTILEGQGNKNASRILKQFNGDAIELLNQAQIKNFSLVGNGATYTGRGVIITTGNDQIIENVDISGTASYPVEIVNGDIALRCRISDGFIQCQTTTTAGIKLPNAETGGDRIIENIQCGGGVLVDLAGSATTLIKGCNTTNIIFNAASKKASIVNCRIPCATDFDILGTDHVITGNVFGVNPVVVNPGVANSTISNNVASAGYRDEADNSTNKIDDCNRLVAFGAGASFDFSNIPQQFTNIKIVVFGRSDAVANLVGGGIRFNDDAGANYDTQYLEGMAAVASAGEAFGDSFATTPGYTASTAGANLFGSMVIEIPNYNNTSNNKMIIAHGGTKIGVAGGNLIYQTRASFWRSNSAITKISLFPSTGNFVAGSRAVMYFEK